MPAEKQLRVLYVGPLGALARSTHRLWCIERLGYRVLGFDTEPYMQRGGPLLSRIRYRTLVGRAVDSLNHDLIEAAGRFQPDIVWLDKASYVRRETVVRLRAGGAFAIHQNDDDPFGPRGDPGWRLILDALPEYDLHLIPREISIQDYREAGARDIFLYLPTYEPTLHFPPPAPWSDIDRTIDVSFVGYPYDMRPAFFMKLWKTHGIRTQIWGPGQRKWKRRLPKNAFTALVRGGALSNDEYRETIWRSRINLGLVSQLNRDDYNGRSCDIPACGGFLLAQDTPGHRKLYRDGEEAVFFNSVEECAEKIRRYLPDEAARTAIGNAGRRRVLESGYGNDARVRQVLDYARMKLTERRNIVPRIAAG